MDNNQLQDNQQQQESTPLYLSSNRARIIYDDNVMGTDEQLDDVLEDDELLDPAKPEGEDDELPELDELPEDPEEEEEDDFVEGSPRFEQFRNDFTKAFGLPLEEARDLVQGLKEESVKRAVNEQKYELSAAWDVPVTEVERRLMIVKTLWDKLPPDKQQAYDSPKGAQVLYAKYSEKNTRKAATSTASTSTAKTKTTGTASKYWYTESQIESMDDATYKSQADRIMVAYAQGKVRKNNR